MNRVFLADTDGENLQILTRLFREMYGLCPSIWRDMPSTLDFLSEQPEGVVFVRIDNPDIEGLSLSCKALAHAPRIRLVWMASSASHGVEAFTYGADAYLLLPASKDRMRDVMRSLEY